MSLLDPNIQHIILGILTTGLTSIAVQMHWTNAMKQWVGFGISFVLAAITAFISHQFVGSWADPVTLANATVMTAGSALLIYRALELVPGQPLTALQAATTKKKPMPTSPPT